MRSIFTHTHTRARTHARIHTFGEYIMYVRPYITHFKTVLQHFQMTGSNNPITHKDLKSAPSNYIPISLTCILCTIMEHIIPCNIWKHLHKNNNLLHIQPPETCAARFVINDDIRQTISTYLIATLR